MVIKDCDDFGRFMNQEMVNQKLSASELHRRMDQYVTLHTIYAIRDAMNAPRLNLALKILDGLGYEMIVIPKDEAGC